MDSEREIRSGAQELKMMPFDPKRVIEGKVHRLACRCTPGLDIFVITNSTGQAEEVAFQKSGAPTVFLRFDGSVRKLSEEEGIIVIEAAKSDGYDCDAAVKWSVQYGMNTAFTGCIRALCKHLNCKYIDQCDGSSVFETEQAVRYFCMGVISVDE